jgi:endoglucanase
VKILISLFLVEFLLFASLNVIAANEPVIAIKGKTFYKNNQPWMPKGVDIEAFSKPAHVREKEKGAMLVRSYWGVAELNAVKEVFGGDILRFQLSQSGLDPQSSAYDANYVPEILAGVREAQEFGFVVILAVDAQQDGTPDLACMPSDSTNRAWKTIAPSFIHEQGVMLELFNEPCKWGDQQAKKEWAQSMQMLIGTIRGLGATNILLLDGLGWGRLTDGLFPLVKDTFPNCLALAVHPYLSAKQFDTEKQWRTGFGISATQYPLIASEWSAATQGKNCIGSATSALALSMTRYLESLHVGLIGWAIDWKKPILVKDHTNFEPTDFTSFRDCNDGSISGIGKLLANYPND